MKERSEFDPKGDLLLKYAMDKRRRSLTIKAALCAAFLALIGINYYVGVVQHDFRLVGVELAVLAGLLIFAICITLSVILFWLNWNLADAAIGKGDTRPKAVSLIVIAFVSAASAAIFAAMTITEKGSPMIPLGLFALLFWLFVTVNGLGYLSRFWAEYSLKRPRFRQQDEASSQSQLP